MFIILLFTVWASLGLFGRVRPVLESSASLGEFGLFGRVRPVWESSACLGEFGLFGRVWPVWESLACLGEFGLCGRVRPVWESSACLGEIGLFGRVQPVGLLSMSGLLWTVLVYVTEGGPVWVFITEWDSLDSLDRCCQFRMQLWCTRLSDDDSLLFHACAYVCHHDIDTHVLQVKR